MKILAILFAALMVGCASFPKPVEEKQLSKVIKGETTKEQVIALFGMPRNVSTVDGPDGKFEALEYPYFRDAQMGSILAGVVRTENQAVVFSIDSSGKVASIATRLNNQ